MRERIAVVGDVHGNARALARAFEWLETWDGLVIFVGDYVNRGPASREVVDHLILAKDALGERLVLLRGNHDQVLLDFISGESPRRLLSHGGLTTVSSYLKGTEAQASIETFRETFPDGHLRLLGDTGTHFETDEMLVSHAGYNPDRPTSRRSEDLALGRHHGIFSRGATAPKALIICGHYIQRGMKPFESRNLICLDTGSGTTAGAPLTLVTLPDRNFYQFYGET
ncbi:metallophosphoesterase [Angustibacter luteus]|uniref:Metallophosphoesterase n=1 Tax=Angustibacter luteus TaxID=658456 RepID=A0ABW1JGP3_9ACTN